MRKCSSTILYAACTFRPYKSTPVLKLFRTFTGRMTKGLSLRTVFTLLFQDTLLTEQHKFDELLLLCVSATTTAWYVAISLLPARGRSALPAIIDSYSAFELLLGTWPSASYHQHGDVLSQLLDQLRWV